MFVDFREPPFPPPSPPPRRRGPPPLTGFQQRVLAWLIGLSLVGLLFGPLAGAGLIQAAIALFGTVTG